MPKDQERVFEVMPYGLRVADDCVHLVQDPQEQAVLLNTLEFIVRDMRLSEVAVELNKLGFRTREGGTWNAANVFELLPRLIEVGPRMFTSEEWVRRRRSLFQSIQQ